MGGGFGGGPPGGGAAGAPFFPNGNEMKIIANHASNAARRGSRGLLVRAIACANNTASHSGFVAPAANGVLDVLQAIAFPSYVVRAHKNVAAVDFKVSPRMVFASYVIRAHKDVAAVGFKVSPHMVFASYVVCAHQDIAAVDGAVELVVIFI